MGTYSSLVVSRNVTTIVDVKTTWDAIPYLATNFEEFTS